VPHSWRSPSGLLQNRLTGSRAARIFSTLVTCFRAFNSPNWQGTPVCLRIAARRVSLVSRTGLTLLEVLVALVILGLVATGLLDTLASTLRNTTEARSWAQALVYAEQGQQMVDVEGLRSAGIDEPLGGGFTRRLEVRHWGQGVSRATITIILPDGERFELDRLVPAP
jgi:prepilin-type N-terminal cleavage/methylation domain-containing protein